ncbi:hypothetical protein CY35_12G024800 [Sphagnum magellanicum]|nr:hypothetical protein CY35_12G024800 [Sphagnum magellanicum]KAH9544995.1 hypothetical protein CY35_12G024800 [Sphagnum magellanicum]
MRLIANRRLFSSICGAGEKWQRVSLRRSFYSSFQHTLHSSKSSISGFLTQLGCMRNWDVTGSIQKSVSQQRVLDKAESQRRSVQTFAPLNADLSLRPCVLIYDGICHLCNAGVRWVIHADKQKKISFCAVQSQAAKPYLTLCGLTEDDVLRRFLFVEGPGVSHQGSTAALKVASYLPVPYSVLTLFLVVPLPIRDAIYDYVAKHRYEWFGRSSDCIIPDDDILDRFVDKLEFQERAEQDDEDDEDDEVN